MEEVVPVLKYHIMKKYEILEVGLHVFLTSTLAGG
jgi:hypothetical protein